MKRNNYTKSLLLSLIALMGILGFACNKIIQIPAPAASITTAQVFADSADATSAIVGLYEQMIQTGGSVNFGSGLITQDCGLSADELLDYDNSFPQIDYNELTAIGGLTDQFWQVPYTYMFSINTTIQAIQASSGIGTATKNQLVGEAKFIRAFCYFYLVNLYGDVPLILTPNYVTNQQAVRTPKTQVYQQIISDLKDAQDALKSDNSISGGMPTRANQAAATALLARTYLYTGDWSDAIAQATSVINNAAYSLVSDPNGVFLVGSSEAILQLQLNNNVYPYNATPEGYNFVPGTGYAAYFTLNPQLQNAFEPGDLRYSDWVDSTNGTGVEQYFPYKYKVGGSQSSPSGSLTEYYMVLRLAEQYLIRAEASANSGDLNTAISDLNVIRIRANLAALPATLNQSQVLQAVMQERRIELFAEWGHRWLDLKRTGAIDSVMTITTPLKGGGNFWQSYQQLYPIPVSEIRDDPNLVQNPRY